MGFFTNLAKILAKESNEDEVDAKNKRAIEWADRIGDTEDAERLRANAVLTPCEARLSAAKTTPIDAVTGLMARKTERRDIRLDAAFEAAKIGEFLP